MTFFSRQVTPMPPAPQDHSQVTGLRMTAAMPPEKSQAIGSCSLEKGLKHSLTGNVSWHQLFQIPTATEWRSLKMSFGHLHQRLRPGKGTGELCLKTCTIFLTPRELQPMIMSLPSQGLMGVKGVPSLPLPLTPREMLLQAQTLKRGLQKRYLILCRRRSRTYGCK